MPYACLSACLLDAFRCFGSKHNAKKKSKPDRPLTESPNHPTRISKISKIGRTTLTYCPNRPTPDPKNMARSHAFEFCPFFGSKWREQREQRRRAQCLSSVLASTVVGADALHSLSFSSRSLTFTASVALPHSLSHTVQLSHLFPVFRTWTPMSADPMALRVLHPTASRVS